MPKTHRLTLPTPIHTAALRGEVSMLLVRMKTQPPAWTEHPSTASLGRDKFIHWMDGGSADCRCWPADEPVRFPYSPGDLIACREPYGRFKNCWLYTIGRTRRYDAPKSKHPSIDDNWFPASRMPLAACRLWFRVQSVEACRVADVTEEEARAMGYREHANCPASYWLPDDLGRWAWKLKAERTENER